MDDKQFEAGEGDVVSVPGGAVHAFVNITVKPAKQLVLMLPGMDARAFFLGLSEVFLTKPNRDELNAFGKPWGVEFLGPPLPPTASRPSPKAPRPTPKVL